MFNFFKNLPTIAKIYLGVGVIILGVANVDHFLGGAVFTASKEKSWVAQGKQHVKGSSWSHK